MIGPLPRAFQSRARAEGRPSARFYIYLSAPIYLKRAAPEERICKGNGRRSDGAHPLGSHSTGLFVMRPYRPRNGIRIEMPSPSLSLCAAE